MEIFHPELTVILLLASCASAFLAGIIKGAVGFGMPMVLISLLSSFLSPNLALAGLILPTLLTNGIQAFREGTVMVIHDLRQFRVFLIVGGIAMIFGAQLVTVIPQSSLFAVIGCAVLLFTILQLSGWRPYLEHHMRALAEVILGSVAGFVGGMSGVWGPPTVMMLTVFETPKNAQLRIQGVVYGMGAILLTASHIMSGVLDASTALFSLMLVIPAIVGMQLGFFLSDKLNQDGFRRATLIVLAITALNLLRRAFGA